MFGAGMFGGVALGGLPSMHATATAGDSLTISESLGRSVLMSRSVGDSITITEGIARSATSQTRSVGETVRLVESVERSVAGPREVVNRQATPLGAFAFGGAGFGGSAFPAEAGDAYVLTEAMSWTGRPFAISETFEIFEYVDGRATGLPSGPPRPRQIKGESNPKRVPR